MGRGSVDAIHTWIECAKLAYADRDANYADPDFADVPLDTLLSESYAAERRSLIDPDTASADAWDLEADRPLRVDADVILWAAPRFVLRPRLTTFQLPEMIKNLVKKI